MAQAADSARMHPPAGSRPSSVPGVPEYTVAELSVAVRRTVEGVFGRIRVRGEVTNLKRPSSGHWYFDLKDSENVVAAVLWRSTVPRLRTNLEDGLEVIVTGRLTTYPGRSQYQLVVDQAELAGMGALLKLLEERRRALAAEGLFDKGRKKRLPMLPEVIGVITSPTGAVFSDILHRLRDRFPRRVLLWPVQVQGAGAAPDIAVAIDGFNRLPERGPVPRPDVLILARGGGSVEDLWAFNEEVVVRAIAGSRIPTISAIGHETDTTLADFAADICAPTPTAAAELAVPVRADLIAAIRSLGGRLFNGTARSLKQRREQVAGLSRGLRGPREILDAVTQRLDHAGMRLDRAETGLVQRYAHRLDVACRHLRVKLLRDAITERAGRLQRAAVTLGRDVRRDLKERARRLKDLGSLLESVSHKSVLKRGYAVVRDDRKRPVTSIAGVKPGVPLDIELKDGHIGAVAAGKPTKKRGPTGGGPDQGSLV